MLIPDLHQEVEDELPLLVPLVVAHIVDHHAVFGPGTLGEQISRSSKERESVVHEGIVQGPANILVGHLGEIGLSDMPEGR
ncbi:hypothetical protein GCM10027073_12270 [Streptomyces chlorus]